MDETFAEYFNGLLENAERIKSKRGTTERNRNKIKSDG
jgi:hypothetical protein